MLRSEQLLSALYRKVLDDVHILTAAVVAAARIPFCILVREERPLRGQYGPAGKIFGSDEENFLPLASPFPADRVVDFRIGAAQRAGPAEPTLARQKAPRRELPGLGL